MEWNSIWNDACPVCGRAVPDAMPPVEIFVDASSAVRLRICSSGCAATLSQEPTRYFQRAVSQAEGPSGSASPARAARPAAGAAPRASVSH